MVCCGVCDEGVRVVLRFFQPIYVPVTATLSYLKSEGTVPLHYLVRSLGL